MKIKYNKIKSLIAILLVVATLLQCLSANIFAVENKNYDYISGDVNGDELIDALDVNLVRRYIAGGYNVEINTFAADVDADGSVTAKDVTNLRKHIAGGYDVVLLRGLERFTVKFETGGGTQIKDQYVLEGTLISSFQKPYWAEHIFVGWCYDAELKNPVENTDKVTGNITLYANWLEQVPLDTVENVNFASSQDVSTDFAITVLASDPEMTAEDVLAVINADDLTDPDATNVVAVNGANGEFTVSGGENGFNEGGSYRIALNSDKLSFKGQPDSAREYNFTVNREEVTNLTANTDIKYLPMAAVSNIVNNGEDVDSLNLNLYETDGTNVSVAELSTGSFNYTGDTNLQIGDVICIYEGEIPTNRTKDTPEEKMGDMAYLEITGISGSKYTYESADADEVIFTPDVLPMPENADTDNDENTVTVENKYLDYSSEVYSYMNLDSQTTVDAGDFFAFYTGELGVENGDDDTIITGYGKITDIKANDNETTTITYIVVTWDEVESCMDVYTEDEMSADELLEGVDTSDMESEIEQQAMDSGFADEAAMYLTSLSLATDNFNALASNMNLDDYKVTLKDGSKVSPEELKLMSGGGVNVEIVKTSVKAKISKKPTHLGDIKGTNADKKGIAISLDVMVVFTISVVEGGCLEITVTGSFVEEVGVDFSASAEAEWDWAVIIPYISDIKASANVDVMNYTAVSFNATMITKEDDSADDGDSVGKAIDMANEIKDLLENMTKGEEQDDDVQDNLVSRYSEMINAESDWVRVVEKNITEVKQSYPFGIPLINISFAVDFVVQMDASISIGFDFEYLEGKRHVFTIRVKAGKVYSDTIDLVEKAYEFSFYAMGRIGLKVGIEMEFAVYAISKKLGSVGFSAGAGAYTKLYGYFFYELKYTDSKGKTQNYSGALLIEVGIYLELALEAQAIGGKYSAKANLLDKEWKLFEVGRRDNVLDFVVQQKDTPEIVMKQFVRRVELPDSFFNMDYLDLLTGEGKQAIYNDWNDPERKDDFRNGENYNITITNDKFTYDPKTNTIAVNPDENDIKLTGEMIVTWKKQPMSFSSKPITRTISLYWDNLRDGYLIVPYSNGGSFVPMIIKNFEAKVTKPADPKKLGYTFAGWYSDTALTIPYTFPELMPNTDTSVYAKWEARTDIPYTVEHYKENFRSGEYELAETEEFKGTTDSIVSPEVKIYEGYVSPAKSEIKVAADGSATLRYYYNLERHNITFDAGVIDGVDVTAESDITYNLKYGASISAPQMAIKGYTFVGWTEDGSTATTVADTVGTKDLTYTAMWQKNEDTEYRIEYYVQQADGRYTLQHQIKDKTATGKVFTEEYLRNLVIDGTNTADQKFLIENAIVFENMTDKGIVCTEAAVEGSGKTVIKINYGRMKHTITFDPNYDGAEPIVKDLFYGADVIVPQNLTRIGYTFAGWEVAPVTTMPAESLVYKAVWTPNTNTKYKVEHYKEQLDGSYILADTDELTGTTDSLVTPETKTYEGFVVPTTQTVTVSADGSLVVSYQYIRNSYTITFDAAGGTVTPQSITAKYGESITLPVPEKEGYGFNSWYKGTELFTDAVMGAENLTVTANWEAGKYGYTVNHYQQNVDGNGYSLVATENGTADMDSLVTPEAKTYEGFTAPNTTTITIKSALGENVVNYYYTRNKYTLTWELGIGSADGQNYTKGELYYGAAVTSPVPEKVGYTFNWDADIISVMPAENLTYTAIWAENTYNVTFHANNGTSEEITSNILYTDTLIENTFERNGYTFIGWSDGINNTVYSTNEKISTFVTKNTASLHLYAVWEKNKYTISYVGVSDDEHSNATEYTVEDMVSLGEPNSRTGYTFKGWFDNANFEGAAVDTITVGSTEAKIFYALWEENAYTVVLNANDGTGYYITTESILYTGNLPENIFIRLGYTFKGWTDGANTYSDLAAIADIIGAANDYNQVTLNAVWEVNKYTITYSDWDIGSNANPNTITEYSSELESDVMLIDPDIKEAGYQFLGWYDGDNKVTTIQKTNEKDYNLVAKWAHGGTFTLQYVSRTDNGNGTYAAKFTIKRTLPNGVAATSAPQVVHVRTVNGTAYGTTPEVATATAQDKYHFVHVNPTKEGNGIVTFGQNDTEKTVIITENDLNTVNDIIASYQLNNKTRYYNVQLYKVVDSTGVCNGVLGNTVNVKRDLGYNANQTINTSTYLKEFSCNVFRWDASAHDTVMGGSNRNYNENWPYSTTFAPSHLYQADMTNSYYRNYYLATSGKLAFRFEVKAKKASGMSTPQIKFQSGSSTLATYTTNSSSYKTYNFPQDTTTWGTVKYGDYYYALSNENEIFSIWSQNVWWKNPIVHVRPYDATAPQQVGIAPMAFTDYKAGDKIQITVNFNEIVSSASNATLGTINGLPIKDVKYVDGVNTNALTFEATVTKDFTIDVNLNNSLVGTKPFKGTIKDFCNNSRTY